MLSALVLIQAVVETYVQSLKKDLAQKRFEIILLVASVAWLNLAILLVLLFLGTFQMPSSSLFYLFWLGVTFIYTIKFALFVTGLKQALFLAGNAFPNLSFALTAIYASVFLGETINSVQIIAIIIALFGALLFFHWNGKIKELLKINKGLLLIAFSVILAPLTGIFYKSATLQTSSYSEFLTGRLVMDGIYYSLFFIFLYVFWHRTNPWTKITSLATSKRGLLYLILTVAYSLLGSWLIFKLPISLFVMLSAIAIPAGYVVGKIKYQEPFKKKYLLGGALIVTGILLFVV